MSVQIEIETPDIYISVALKNKQQKAQQKRDGKVKLLAVLFYLFYFDVISVCQMSK